MRTRRAVGGKRLLAVCAGMMLLGTIGAGSAFAADGGTTTPSVTTPTVTTVTTPTVTTVTTPTVSTVTTPTVTTTTPTVTTPTVTTPTVTTPTTSTTPTGSLFPTFPQIPGTSLDPTSLAGQSPSVACANISSALINLDPTKQATALSSPAALFCQQLGLLTGIPGTGTGTGTTPSTTYPYDPCYYGYSSCYGWGNGYPTGYDDGYRDGAYKYATATPAAATVPATATQVTSVPTGGVNTGDGSY